MKKLFAIMLALVLVASFAVTAFATEGEEILSPTDVPQITVDFDSEHPGAVTDVTKGSYPEGSEITFTAPASEYDFLGFTVEGEYEIVSGEEFLLGGAGIGSDATPTLVLVAKSDLNVVAHYDIDEEPTTATQPDDEDGDSPQTGDSMLVYCIAGALILGVIGFAFAGKKLAKKEN